MRGHINFTAYIRKACLPCTNDNCLTQYLTQKNMTTGQETPEERCRIESKV